MRLFIDTEFCPVLNKLISIGIVSEQGSSFYAVISTETESEWVKENVLPKLGSHLKVHSKADIQLNLRYALQYYQNIEVIADWPDDIKYFCELLITGPGERIPGIFKFTLWDSPPFPDHPMRHNALTDACLLREAWLFAHK